MHQLDDEMKRTDELLYQMIPKSVADRLRKGEPAVNTCEVCFIMNSCSCGVVYFVGTMHNIKAHTVHA